METGEPLLEVANLYFFMGERLELDWFAGQILASKVDNEWQALARDTYLEDLEWQQRTLAMGALQHMEEDGNLLWVGIPGYLGIMSYPDLFFE